MTVLFVTDSITYFQFQFKLVVSFYAVVEEKLLPIIDSTLSSKNNF